MAQAKESGKLQKVEELRKKDPRQFSLMVLEFRSKCLSCMFIIPVICVQCKLATVTSQSLESRT